MDDTYVDLIHHRLDGELSPDESTRLDAYLARHPEAKTLADDLATLVAALDRIEPRDPPAHLKHAVMAALPAGRYAPQRVQAPVERSSLWDALRSLVEGRPRLALAYAFSVGLVLGLVAFGLVGSGLRSPSDGGVVGTMGPPAGPATLAEATLVGAGGTGAVRLLDGSPGAVIALDAEVPDEAEVVLLFPEDAYSFHGYTHTSGGSVTLRVSAGRVHLSPGGARALELRFNEPARASAPFRVQVVRDGSTLAEHTLAASAQ